MVNTDLQVSKNSQELCLEGGGHVDLESFRAMSCLFLWKVSNCLLSSMRIFSSN